MPNQHLPNPPLEEIKDGIRKFWRQGLNDKQILRSLIQGGYFKTDTHGLAVKKLRKYREKLGLVRARSAKLTVQDIRAPMTELRAMYPKAGTRDMLKLLKEEHGLHVTRTVLTDYFHRYEPRLVRQRRYERFRRKRFWAAGVMDMICCDQHDKWQRYGLRLHTGIDPFIGKIHWLKVWHTNKNPVLIASYYLDDAQETGSIPLVTQSDPGTENFGLAKAQTFLRHWHDADMHGQ
ncbi:hypothetical protein ONZ45_g12770 [Pleurotus djamor]|nr:hypothetical protein ONZ45_g12770 [Pleurotus djamor]